MPFSGHAPGLGLAALLSVPMDALPGRLRAERR